MATTVLERQPLVIPDTPAELLGETPRERQEHRSARALAGIGALFTELGIQPFTEESVVDYKRQKIAEERRRFKRNKVLIGAGLVCLIALSFLMGLILDTKEAPRIAALVCTFSGICILLNLLRGKSWEWRRVSWGEYAGAIPRSVENQRQAILRICPEANCRVEYLVGTPCPFLVVSFYDAVRHDFYVEVWGERKFRRP